jgi:hypothetical protein
MLEILDSQLVRANAAVSMAMKLIVELAASQRCLNMVITGAFN